MNARRKIVVIALLSSFALSGAAHAEPAKRSSGGADTEALLRAQSQVREMAAERDALELEVKKMKDETTEKDSAHKKQLAGLNEKLMAAERSQTQLQGQNMRALEGNDALRDRIKDQHEKMQKLVDKYKELVAALRQVEGERSELNANHTAQTRQLEVCETRNVKLYETALEVLDRYENKGVWEALVQREPVTQLKRVEIENLVQDYKYRMSAQRVESAAGVQN